MLYTLEQGKTEQFIIRQCVIQHLPLPDKIANAPELLPGLGFFYRAFMDLTTCRGIGMAEGPIPWTAIKAWADEYNAEGDLREEIFYHVTALDNVYLTHRAEKLEKGK